VLLLLAGVSPQVTAQNPISPTDAEQSAACLPHASRARASCDPTQVVVRTETEVLFSFELPAHKIAHCAATTEIEYTQRDTIVSVEGTIENTDCAASNGEYKLAVRIRDENRELRTLEFLGSWQRQDDQPVTFRGDYPIGANVDVVSVRPSQLACVCADPPAE
jgi:hypothetical protein